MNARAIVLAAGKGTRMNHPDLPKVLVMFKQKPLILHLLEEIGKINQLAKPVVVVGYKHNQVQQVLGHDYIYALQQQQLGTGHAVMCAEGSITGDNILVLYGDMPFINADSLKKLMRLHHEQQASISMLTTTVNDFSQFPSHYHYGRIIRDTHGNIIKITEFKDASPEERNIREVNPGIYMFNTEWLFAHIHSMQNKNTQSEYYLTDIVEIAIADGQRIESLAINPREVVGINSPEELKQAEAVFVSKAA